MPLITDRKPLNSGFSRSRDLASGELVFVSDSFDYRAWDYSQYLSQQYSHSDAISSYTLLGNGPFMAPLDGTENFKRGLPIADTLWPIGLEGYHNETFSRPNRNRSQSVNHAVTRANNKSFFSSKRPRSSSMGTSSFSWSKSLSTLSNDEQSTLSLIDLEFVAAIANKSECESNRKTNMENNCNKNVPLKSLWIDNIGSTISVEELTQFFSSYGPIENIQLIVEKESGLINFYNQKDAVRAKEDIITRLGGCIGPCVLRSDYDKAEKLADNTPVVTQLTRSLWLGNMSSNITQTILKRIFAPFGTIESIKVISHKHCGFINYEAAESASAARDALLQNEVQELMGVRIGFGKVLGSKEKVAESNENTDTYVELRDIMEQLGAKSDSLSSFKLSQCTSYFEFIPPVPEYNSTRILDGSRLKDIRKRLDNMTKGHSEADELAYECINEIVMLCSDYIGNTVVQRLFEKCSDDVKTKMLENIVPHLAAIGVHKNGTWAAQKIINLSSTEKQMKLVCKYLLPFIPALLLDPFGNYVVQCCLRLNCDIQFIVSAIIDKLVSIVQGRFGSRAVRGIMESRLITLSQQTSIAAAVIQNTVSLSTHTNGILVLSWLIDSPLVEGKRWLIASRLTPYIAQLATHKSGSHILLKLIFQDERRARQCLLRALADEKILLSILSDQDRGLSFALKVISNQQIPAEDLIHLQEITHSLLTQLQGTGYKKALLEFINVE